MFSLWRARIKIRLTFSDGRVEKYTAFGLETISFSYGEQWEFLPWMFCQTTFILHLCLIASWPWKMLQRLQSTKHFYCDSFDNAKRVCCSLLVSWERFSFYLLTVSPKCFSAPTKAVVYWSAKAQRSILVCSFFFCLNFSAGFLLQWPISWLLIVFH